MTDKTSMHAAAQAMQYPPTRQVEVVDDYHGTRIHDPYRWLEDLNAADTRNWIAAQNSLTESYLAGLPARSEILARLMRLAGSARRGLPREAAGNYFRLVNDGTLDQDQLVVSQGLDGAPRLLLDPNGLSDDGSVSLLHWLPSKDGTKLLYGLSSSGSDWTSWRVRDVASGADLPDVIQHAKYANAHWDPDGASFCYLRFPAPLPGQEYIDSNRAPMICRHILGQPQEQDRVLFSLPQDPEDGIFFDMNDARDLLVIYGGRRGQPGNRIYLLDAQDAQAVPQLLVDSNEHSMQFLGNEADRLWFRTSHEAPAFRIVEIERSAPKPSAWRTIVAEQDQPLRQAALYCGHFICQYLEHATSVVRIHALDGSFVSQLVLPGNGNVENMQGSAQGSEFFLSYTDAITPDLTLGVSADSLATGQAIPVDPAVDNGFDSRQYETRTLFYESRDGKRIPLHIAHRRGLVPDGNHPTILYGYGGFGIPQIPKFTPARAAWIEMGGVFAIAGIRGGAEYGQVWHHSAIKQNRQRSYDDFICAAEFLISEGYTSSDRLAIQGRSNGGLLVGAVMCQRPELFAVALPQVGVMDMLRFNQFTAGPHWESDFGSPQDPQEFTAIHAYSPLHNLHEQSCYPATLITTGDTDDRVVPSHSYKFAARLQAVQACANPVLLRVDSQAGHGQGKPIAQEMREFADMYAFALHNMGIATG